MIKKGWECPSQTLKDVTMEPKLLDNCNEKELRDSEFDTKDLHIIVKAMSTCDAKHISSCKSSKKSLEYLEIKYENYFSNGRQICEFRGWYSYMFFFDGFPLYSSFF